MNRKVKSLNSVSTGIMKYFAVSKVSTCVRVLSFGIYTAPQSFCHSFIALPMILCSKSAQKSPVQVNQVTIVVMEITQLVIKSILKLFI